MKKLILISLLTICIITLQAQDFKFITSDTIWVSDTVKIFQNIVIADTSILIINPGVYIEFQGNYSIDVYGKIRAIGTINDSIIFTINDPASIDDTTTINGGWGGIRFLTNNSDTSFLSYCRFSFGKAVVPGVTWDGPNNEDNKGGAIYLKGYAHLVISNSTFYHNRANYRGGGIMTKNCSSIHLLDNTFKYNQVYFTGGGVSIESSGFSIISGNLFEVNEAFRYSENEYVAGAGSGLAVYCNSIICNNKFFSNNSVNGAIYESAYNGLIYNNIVSNNMGSGIFNGHSFSISKYINNTITNNMSYDHIGCGIGLNSDEIKMRNNIVWGNDTSPGWPFDPIQVYPITANFNYGCNPDGYPGEGNITDNPLFVNPTEGAGPDYDGSAADWSLQNSSPCVNTGTPDTTGLNLPEFDIAGNPRLYGIRVDMGAYENQVVVGLPKNPLVNSKSEIVPNPFKDRFSINLFGENKISRISVLNQSGISLSDTKHFPTDGFMFIDLNGYPSGLYLVVVEYEEGTRRVEKVLKQ
jgi:hypothetical protein